MLGRTGRTPIDPVRWLLFPPTAILLVQLAFAFAGYVVLLVERGEPVVLTARTLSIYVREAAARTWFVFLWPLGAARGMFAQAPEPGLVPKGRERRSPPILLVPSHGRRGVAMRYLQRFLVARGFRWVWAIPPSPRTATLAQRAEDLAKRVREIQQLTGADQVDLVAFSLGGLASAWYCKRMDGSRHVRRLITIGTPWRGTKLAVFVRGALGREIMYGSHLLDDLAPPGVSTISIWSPDDPVVVPSTSAAPDGVESVCIEAAGHVELLISARAFRAVFAALQHAPVRTAPEEMPLVSPDAPTVPLRIEPAP